MHTTTHYFSCLALAFAALVSSQASGQADSRDTPEQEAENVARLHRMLQGYYADQQAPASIPRAADSEAVPPAAEATAPQLISSDNVLLTGQEGSNALAEITQRLGDAAIPDSRRDTAPICMIRTHLFDTLVGSDNRSLRPVGKNHFVGTARLQPGESTIGISSQQWKVQIPPETPAKDYLITLYRPDNAAPELHVIAVEDLLAAGQAAIPAWFPEDLDIRAAAE